MIEVKEELGQRAKQAARAEDGPEGGARERLLGQGAGPARRHLLAALRLDPKNAQAKAMLLTLCPS